MDTLSVFCVPAGPLRANCYVVTADGKRAVLIDCGGEEPLAFAARKGIKIESVLLTHGHFDHIAGCAALQRAGAKIGCAEEERALLSSQDNLAAAMGLRVPPFSPDFTFRGGDVLELCGMRFGVLAAPGHTRGGVCFLCGDSLFTGDTLFCESVGRTDFPGGSAAQLRQSVQALLSIEGDKTVYPGHDEPTTLSHERKYNPFR